MINVIAFGMVANRIKLFANGVEVMERINVMPSNKDIIRTQQQARANAYAAELRVSKQELSYLVHYMEKASFTCLSTARELAQAVVRRQTIIDIKEKLV